MKLYTIDSGHFKLDGGAMHGVVPKSLWQTKNPCDENNMCSWAMRCLLIEMDNRLILVDTGIGDKQDDKFFSYYYLHGTTSLIGEIQKAGYSPEDITDVFLTHLHFDHVGGAVKKSGDKLIPTFKNAIYWSNKSHWNWAVYPNNREKASFLKENILPIQESGQLQWIEIGEDEEWLPGIRIKYVHGHTESMMLPVLDYNGKTILYCADLIPSMAHIALPWIMSYDIRAIDTLHEKERILKEAADKDYYLYFEHDNSVELCTLSQTERGIKQGEILKLTDI